MYFCVYFLINQDTYSHSVTISEKLKITLLSFLYEPWSAFIVEHSKLNSVALVRERIISTERLPLVGEVVPTFADKACRVVSATDSTVANLGFLDRNRYFSFK
jgi:hypothetical protein